MNKKYFNLSLIIIFSIVVLDQLSKYLIVKYVGLGDIIFSIFNGYARIVHVRNLGALFSMGDGFNSISRTLLLIVIPLTVLTLLFFNLILSKDTFKSIFKFNPPLLESVSTKEVTFLSIIIGGGLGNLIDRVFRPHGVVDFIDLSFFGILGYERWPTFNIADISVTMGAGCLLLDYLLTYLLNKKRN